MAIGMATAALGSAAIGGLSSAYGAYKAGKDRDAAREAYENSPERQWSKQRISEANRIYGQGPGQLLGPQHMDTTSGQRNALGYQQQLAGSGLMPGIADDMMAYGRGGMQGGQQAQQYYQDMMRSGGPQMDFELAARYADNPYMDDMIAASSRDVSRNLYENELPASRLAAARAGQTGGSSRYKSGDILRRGAEDSIRDISAGLRGQAYGKGLDMTQAQQQFNANLQRDAAARAAALGQQGLSNLQGGASALYNNAAYQTQLANQEYNQQNLDYRNQRFAQDERNNQDLNFYNRFGGMPGGAPSLGMQPAQTNPWQMGGSMMTDLAGTFGGMPQSPGGGYGGGGYGGGGYNQYGNMNATNSMYQNIFGGG